MWKDYPLKMACFVASSLFFMSNCGCCPEELKSVKNLPLKPGEKVSVRGADLAIRLKVVGHQWYAHRRADSLYVELELFNCRRFRAARDAERHQDYWRVQH